MLVMMLTGDLVLPCRLSAHFHWPELASAFNSSDLVRPSGLRAPLSAFDRYCKRPQAQIADSCIRATIDVSARLGGTFLSNQ